MEIILLPWQADRENSRFDHKIFGVKLHSTRLSVGIGLKLTMKDQKWLHHFFVEWPFGNYEEQLTIGRLILGWKWRGE